MLVMCKTIATLTATPTSFFNPASYTSIILVNMPNSHKILNWIFYAILLISAFWLGWAIVKMIKTM